MFSISRFYDFLIGGFLRRLFMFSRNSLIQILHRITSVRNLVDALITYSLPAVAQEKVEEAYPLLMEEEADEIAASDQLLATAISFL
ncbi:uncharacterized protein METZ01_LOCUS170833 [marine metagenome]|uniref:Uncharacterized protein n=1 Tax=marine metagenome TaxID=408172 RepID=A0A382BWI9_9ZZZZ